MRIKRKGGEIKIANKSNGDWIDGALLFIKESDCEKCEKLYNEIMTETDSQILPLREYNLISHIEGRHGIARYELELSWRLHMTEVLKNLPRMVDKMGGFEKVVRVINTFRNSVPYWGGAG